MAIQRVDAIEQMHCILGLVRLQLADKVQLDTLISLAQGRPFLCRFLHPVFAEDALASLDQRRDALGGMGLADRDQRHIIGLAPRDFRGGGDAFQYFMQAGGWLIHGAVL